MSDYEVCDMCGNIIPYDFINYIKIEGIDRNYEICETCYEFYHFDKPKNKYELETGDVHIYSDVIVPSKECINSVKKILNFRFDNLKSEIEKWNNLKTD
ncbi:hypothetical protein ma748 [Moumouvirus australiensis]|uniref:Uncharacterized protein n=1 Tax=Moumouvirus australiensis TaxID=2109587 RepID=A0A2P1EMK5_9VIRU|nr:hypothetical protein QKC55_gp156 [Moumouvirus australiensis]AVL95135.1 hypothetical protein ma748 [Moumouvirus australiensis]